MTEIDLTRLMLVPCGSRRTSPHTVHHKLQIIFLFTFGHQAHCGMFENGVLLMYTLEGVSSVSSVANSITAYEDSQ